MLWLTFILRSELLHFWRQRFVEALLSAYQRLAYRVIIITHHTGMTPHLESWRHVTCKNTHNDIVKTFQPLYIKYHQPTWCMKGSSDTPPARGRSEAPPPVPAPCSLLSMLLVWGRHMAPGGRAAPPPAGKYIPSEQKDAHRSNHCVTDMTPEDRCTFLLEQLLQLRGWVSLNMSWCNTGVSVSTLWIDLPM